MQKWEYRFEMSTEWIGQSLLNLNGRSGWELVTILYDGKNYIAYFKRPKS
jgi:hypothetical protein